MTVSVAVIAVLTGLVLVPSNSAAQDCEPPTINSAASVEAVRAYFQKRNMTVVTFLGYSAADYEDKAAMLKRAEGVLSGLDPSKTIVNIGATIDGIGAVYALAKQKGFETVGIATARISPPRGRYLTRESQRAFYTQLLDRLRGSPGITAVAVTTQLPFDAGERDLRDVRGRLDH